MINCPLRYTLLTLVVLLAQVIAGCATTTGVSSSVDKIKGVSISGGGEFGTGKYVGPRVDIAVLRFTDETGGKATTGYRWYSQEVGDAMARKLTSSLQATKRFRFVQSKNLSELMNELNFGASGAIAPNSAAQFGKSIGARLVVIASITDLVDGSKEESVADGDETRKKSLLGVLGSKRRTYMAVNLKVVDVETAQIVASDQFYARVADFGFGALLGPRSSVVGGVGVGWDNEPKGKALVKVINSIVEYLEDSIPKRYYTAPGIDVESESQKNILPPS